MPVMERGIGLDRSYHRLPVLFVDDYSNLTPQLLRQVRVRGMGIRVDEEGKKEGRKERREEKLKK